MPYVKKKICVGARVGKIMIKSRLTFKHFCLGLLNGVVRRPFCQSGMKFRIYIYIRRAGAHTQSFFFLMNAFLGKCHLSYTMNYGGPAIHAHASINQIIITSYICIKYRNLKFYNLLIEAVTDSE